MANRSSVFMKNRGKTMKRTIAPLGLALAMMALSACEGSVTISPSGSPSSSASVLETPTPTTSATTSASSLAGTVINGIPTKKEIVQDENGPYIQSTIEVDDPAMKYNPAVVEATALEAYSAEDIAKAQQFVIQHIAEEGIDSILNGTKANQEIVDKWWAANKDKYDPQYSAEIPVRLASNDKVVMPLYRYTGEKSKLVSGENVTHVNSRSITPVAIRAGELEGKMRLGFQVNSNTVYNIVTESGNKTVNAVSAEWIYTLTKNDSNGEWMISGFQNTFTSDVA